MASYWRTVEGAGQENNVALLLLSLSNLIKRSKAGPKQLFSVPEGWDPEADRPTI